METGMMELAKLGMERGRKRSGRKTMEDRQRTRLGREKEKGRHLTISVGSFESGSNLVSFASITSCLNSMP